MAKRKFHVALVLVFGSLGLIAVAIAAGTGPQTLFTDNLSSTGPSTAVTVMEQALLDRLDAAAVSIDATLYDFNRVSVREALIDAHNRGVAVRVVTDDEAYADPDYAPHFQALESAGIPVVNDMRSSIMHNKFFVIDGQQVWTGSTNLTDNGFTYNHNNSLVISSTLMADIFTLEFGEMFESGLFGAAKTDNVTHTLSVDGVPLEVYFSPSDGALSQVIEEVSSATDSIHFSIFFFTSDELRDAFLERADAGVSISGVWDALGAGNAFSDDEALCAAGVPIKIEDLGGKMHNKFMVIDAGGTDPRVVTGSMNWSNSGDEDNDENTLIVFSADVAAAYQVAFDELYDALGPDTLCELGVYYIHLPVLVYDLPPTPTPTPTWTPTPTQTGTPVPTTTPTPTLTPTPTQTSPPPTTGNINIFNIFADGAGSSEPDEHVDLRNDDNVAIQLSGWTLRDQANHVFTFPSYLIQPGEVCRVYTNEFHPEWCGFNYGSGSAIWNNGGDCAYLRDSQGQDIDMYCY